MASIFAVWSWLALSQGLIAADSGVFVSFAGALAIVAATGRGGAVRRQGIATAIEGRSGPTRLRGHAGSLAAWFIFGVGLQPWLGWFALATASIASELRIASFDRPCASLPHAIAILVLAPLFEELLYRGRWLPVLQGSMGRAPAVLVSAATFALPHLDLIRIWATFLVGCVLGLLRLHTGRIAPCVALHAGLNFSACWLGTGAAPP